MECYKIVPGHTPVKLDADPLSIKKEGLNRLYKLIDTSIVERVQLTGGHEVWADEEGLLKRRTYNSYASGLVCRHNKWNMRDFGLVGIVVLRIKKGYALAGNHRDGFYIIKIARDGTAPPLDLTDPMAGRQEIDVPR